VLEQAEQDRVVSLIEDPRARTKVVCFCSNHILGTALLPPSVDGLRWNRPVTCGFRPARPARSRRPCAVPRSSRAHGTCARSREGGGRFLPLPRMFSSCRCSPPSFAAPGFLGAMFAGIASPSRLQSRRLTSRSLVRSCVSLRTPRLLDRACASVISELASCMRCPGLGLGAPSCLGFEAHAPPRAIVRDCGVPAHGQRRRSCLRHHGNLLAYQVPRRGHLHPHKGKRRTRIVPPLNGESAGSSRECSSGASRP
jgi:hypothetical protein